MEQRKLASIQRISAIADIPNADNIKVATILGWQVVINNKDNFKVNDLVVYIEIDSILPQDNPVFEFLKDSKYRIKTRKFKGTVSQGICFSLSILRPYLFNGRIITPLEIGEDVTEKLGIKKHDPLGDKERLEQTRRESEHSNRLKKYLNRFKWYRNFLPKARISFPNFISKTDESRIQLFPDIGTILHNGGKIDVTEKLDGQSASYFMMRNPKKYQIWRPYLFGVCSRNFQLTRPDNSSYWVVAKQENIKDKLLAYLMSHTEYNYITIQGEIIGPGIQGNKYNCTKYELYLFNVVLGTSTSKTYSSLPTNMVEKIAAGLMLKSVPIIGLAQSIGHNQNDLPNTIPGLVEYAKGVSTLAPIPREGVVIRQGQLYVDRSFKIINTDFLLKYGE